MKKIINRLLPLFLTAALFNSAVAQRGSSRGDDRDRRGSQVSEHRTGRSERTYRNSAAETRHVRENNATTYNRPFPGHREDVRSNANRYSRLSTNQQRNDVALLERGRHNNPGLTQQRVYRENDIGRERYVSRNVYNTYNNTYYRGGYHHVFMPGPRYRMLPRSFITINFGGYPYHYNDGLFYGSYGGYYQPLFPPPGIIIRVLPFGYRRIFIGANLFYYFNGIYYRQHDKNDYEVVDAPMGATVSSLPKGAKSVVLNGEKLYELNGTYYKNDRNFKGETVYTVVGKNGEVNNSDNTEDNILPPASLSTGDIINQLPGGSKVVTINGEKLYVTPDDIYLKEESNGNIVQYKVIGK